ncbi:MAG: hypothetical protein LBQ68_02835 [Clostridiales bacterium]|jgi:Tfp pilus assembly protein FimT|nr:hypothetical protein [Clostridiales bacterium]
MQNSKLRNESGITLLELSITLAISFILLSGITLSLHDSKSKRALQSACLQVQEDLRYAQQVAILGNAQYMVTFSTDHYTLKAHALDRNGVTKYYNNGVKFIYSNAGDSRIIFTKRGTVSGGSGTYIFSNGGFKQEVTVLVGSGRVSIKQAY